MQLRVEKRRAEEALQELLSLGIMDRERRILRDGDWVEFPILRRPPPGLGDIVEGEGAPKGRQVPPFEKIFEAARIPASLKPFLPKKWEKLGRVVVVRLPRKLRGHGIEAARAYAGVLGADTVLNDLSGSRGSLREPTMELLLGDNTETLHVENGIRYSFDAARIMFSSGNIEERIRMGKAAGRGETVADLFAGIGYFTIPMAVGGRPSRIFACELNPVAFWYLRQNIRLNKVDRIVRPLEGDCREVAPEGLADRVVLGHFDSIGFIPKALRVLKKEGGIMHLHCLCRKDRIPTGAWEPAKRKMLAGDREGRLLGCVRVKSFKPRIWHVVLDVEVDRATGNNKEGYRASQAI